MQTIDSKMRSRIYGNGRSWVFSPNQFLDLGSKSVVGVVLQQLAKAGTIQRLAKGLRQWEFEFNHQ